MKAELESSIVCRKTFHPTLQTVGGSSVGSWLKASSLKQSVGRQLGINMWNGISVISSLVLVPESLAIAIKKCSGDPESGDALNGEAGSVENPYSTSASFQIDAVKQQRLIGGSQTQTQTDMVSPTAVTCDRIDLDIKRINKIPG